MKTLLIADSRNIIDPSLEEGDLFMKIRLATLSDAKGIAKVHVDSWRSTYASIIPR